MACIIAVFYVIGPRLRAGLCKLEMSSETLWKSVPVAFLHIRKLHKGIGLLQVIRRQEFENPWEMFSSEK